MAGDPLRPAAGRCAQHCNRCIRHSRGTGAVGDQAGLGDQRLGKVDSGPWGSIGPCRLDLLCGAGLLSLGEVDFRKRGWIVPPGIPTLSVIRMARSARRRLPFEADHAPSATRHGSARLPVESAVVTSSVVLSLRHLPRAGSAPAKSPNRTAASRHRSRVDKEPGGGMRESHACGEAPAPMHGTQTSPQAALSRRPSPRRP